MENTVEDFMDTVDSCTLIKSIKYDTETHLWTIEYKNELKSDIMGYDILLDFLENG